MTDTNGPLLVDGRYGALERLRHARRNGVRAMSGSRLARPGIAVTTLATVPRASARHEAAVGELP